jgi:hypothetical protein
MGNAYRVLIRKPEGKRQLGKSRCRWRIIVKWVLKGNSMGWCGLN